MSTQASKQRELNVALIDAYDRRFDRMSVLVDWLTHKVVVDEFGHRYDAELSRAVSFLDNEMDDARAELEGIGAEGGTHE